MIIKRTNPFSGVVNTLDINVSVDDLQKWSNGMCIQNAMPHLTPDEREFIMTGITPHQWDNIF